MEELVPLIAIVCLFVILPGMGMWFADRQRRWKAQQGEASQLADADLLRLADRLEKRVEALEKILDSEAPNWRARHHG
ncbi:envelope stress response membrane protein PspB [Hydrocarboniphaga sp.]|uniref:envelope stress response membrane protein PspB n=1 Tax=Hydrocarboniphaga sp. TaxID=2033016 RepID=UPI00260E0B5C|nr:envelope stress response membrane protein PspB [Hydrocarboniphaga sp.]